MAKPDNTNRRFVKGFEKADKKPVKRAKKNNDVLQSFFNDIDSAKGNPRFQIIVAHGVIEVLVNALIDIHCKHGEKLQDNRDFPHGVKLLLLHELGHITDEHYDMLKKFKKLRNAASHGGHFQLTEKMVAPFVTLNSPTRKFKLDDPANITVLCHLCVLIFWNVNIGMMYDYFSVPTITVDASHDGFADDSESAFDDPYS